MLGLCTTKCPCHNSDFQMSCSEIAGKRRCFAYITAPKHVLGQLLELHANDFKRKNLIIEKAKCLPKAKVTDGINKKMKEPIFPHTQFRRLHFETEYVESV